MVRGLLYIASMGVGDIGMTSVFNPQVTDIGGVLHGREHEKETCILVLKGIIQQHNSSTGTGLTSEARESIVFVRKYPRLTSF